MTEPTSVNEILDFAISKEEEAYQFYTELANTMEKPHMRLIFEEFAGEEKKHKEKLEAVKNDRLFVPAPDKITDLKISDYLVDVEPTTEMEYQDALIVAMKREKASFKLYTNLAETTDNENVRNMFLFLAQEEAKHKLRLEIEYDDYVLGGN